MNKTPCIAAFCFALPFILLTTAYAETVANSGELSNNKRTMAYLNTLPFYEAANKLSLEQDKKLGLQADCKASHRVTPVSLAVLSPIEFPDNQQNPTSGIWSFRYQFERCGESTTYNTIFIANADGTFPVARPYYPGSSRAGPTLIKDALRSAVPSALLKSGNMQCKEIDMLDMRVTQQPQDVTEGDHVSKGVWKEAWTFKICGKPVDTDITFIPDATGGGTSYVVGMGKAGDKKP